MDAVPGRLNETWYKVDKEGTYFGQCSELCGLNHSYMPIVVKAVSKEKYEKWIVKQLLIFSAPDIKKINLAKNNLIKIHINQMIRSTNSITLIQLNPQLLIILSF